MIGLDLYSFLTTDTGISALVSSRVYPNFLPQDVTYPALVFARESTNREGLLEGGDTFVRSVFQFFAVGEYADVQLLAKAVIDAFNAVEQQVIGNPSTGTFIGGTEILDQSDEYDAERRKHVAAISIGFHFHE